MELAQPLVKPAVPSGPLAEPFRLGAVGDLMYLRPIARSLVARSPELIDLLGSVDLLFGNLETSLLDLDGFGGSPQAESGGTWLLAPPEVAQDLRSLGFDAVSLANNHLGDWGVEGLRTTISSLRQAGIAWAGAGETRSAAIAPRYLDLPAGRVAIVAATTSFTAHSRAGDPLGQVPGRPGVAAIRSRPVAQISPDDYETLKRLAGSAANFLNKVTEEFVDLMGGRFRPAGHVAQGSVAVDYLADAGDLDAVLSMVRQARQNSNFVVFSLHSHEPTNASAAPAGFVTDICRQAVDAGADIVVGHGPHQLRGIEVHAGVPILYSLGDFAMMSNSMDLATPETYDACGVSLGAMTVPEMLAARNEQLFPDEGVLQSAVIVLELIDGERTLTIHPIDLGRDERGAARGVPRPARGAVASQILARLSRLSADLGTELLLEQDRAVLVLPDQEARQKSRIHSWS